MQAFLFAEISLVLFIIFFNRFI